MIPMRKLLYHNTNNRYYVGCCYIRNMDSYFRYSSIPVTEETIYESMYDILDARFRAYNLFSCTLKYKDYASDIVKFYKSLMETTNDTKLLQQSLISFTEEEAKRFFSDKIIACYGIECFQPENFISIIKHGRFDMLDEDILWRWVAYKSEIEGGIYDR